MPWRAEDEVLLQRLEDETLVMALFSRLGAGDPLHPRAGGLVGEVRRLPGGAAAVATALGGEIDVLARFVDGLALREAPPQLLHHLALFHGAAARALEASAPEAAATSWVKALAAWLALAEERAYLARLEDAVLGADVDRGRAAGVRLPPEQVPVELVGEIAGRAAATARDLGPPGKAALLALARSAEAARLATASPAAARRVRVAAERGRNAAIESALAVVGEGLDEANVRGELSRSGATLLVRALAVWSWTGRDEQVEHFVVERVEKIGWELYRARNWSSLRYLLDPFRPIFESLATRIERDPTQIAYAAGCAQMFVFMSEVEPALPRKLELGERALRLCPTHRNGRLVLASYLCDDAIDAMKKMVVFARRAEVERIEASLARAESLYPQSSALPDARQMLERVKKGRIAV